MISLDPNCEVLRSLVSEYHSGGITMIFGNAASGKTTACLLSAISASSNGKVIYLDCENGFSVDRLGQLYGKDTSLILDKIFLLQPKTYMEQHESILNIKRLCENPKIKLVIVDTITNLYREAVSENPKEANKLMVEQMANLVRIARDLDKIVLVTNQVYSGDLKDEIKVVGGKLMIKFCKCIIELNKIGQKRYATLNKHDTEKIGKKLGFKIEERGLFLCD